MEKKCKIIYLNNFIYILSDDEIKEGDWCLDTVNNILFISDGNLKLHKNTDKKIIATTDTSLNYFINSNGNKSSHELTKSGYIEFLPQPSQQFIEKYIESYNRGEIITDVLVEYVRYTNDGDTGNYETIEKLVVNPKDNTITIKKLKDSWNREEIINMLFKVAHYCQGDMQSADLLTYQWIEKNL